MVVEVCAKGTCSMHMASVHASSRLTTPPPQPHHARSRAARDEDREESIRQALEERAQFNSSFEDLHHKSGIPGSTLCDRARGFQSCQKAHKDYQPLTFAMEDALVKRALRMDSRRFILVSIF